MQLTDLEKYVLQVLNISEEQFQKDIDDYNSKSVVTQIKNKVKTAHEVYEEALTNPDITLDELKLFKLEQLDEACNLAIVSGFTYALNEVEYLFSSSLSAQANFQGTDTLFKDGLITEAEWTVTNVATGKIERVMIDQANFNNIKLLVFQHINNNVSKLRNELQPLVENALGIDEVDAIKWE